MAPDQQISDAQVYDCIVLGFGGVGSQALRHAAMQGWKTLGIDQHGPAHDRGSSHGQTRLIHQAYPDDPRYLPLLVRAFVMWDELNKRHRTSPDIKELLTQCGSVQIGKPDSPIIQRILSSAGSHDLKIEQFTADQVMQRLPIFKLSDDLVGVFDPGAGFLRVEICVAAAIKQAVKSGAELKSGQCVDHWQAEDDGTIVVTTDQQVFKTKRLIVAAGAWSERLLPGVDLKMKVWRKQQQWFQIDRVDQKLVNRFPCFTAQDENGNQFYGVPEIDSLGMKVCKHTGGQPLESADQLDNDLDLVELAEVEAFMGDYLNFSRSRLVHHTGCMHSMTADGNFVVDRHPANPNVTFAAGLSGHGFKFAPVLGKYLVDMLQGADEAEFDFLRLR